MSELRVKCGPDDKVSRDEHKHLCECGTCWKHSNKVKHASKAEFQEAHSCPSCGTFVNEKHDYSPPLTIADELPPTLREEHDMLDALDPILIEGDKLTSLLVAHEIFEHERARILKERDAKVAELAHCVTSKIGQKKSFADVLENSFGSVMTMAKAHNKELRNNKLRYSLACDAALVGTPLEGLASEGFELKRQLVTFDLTYARRFGFGFAYRALEEATCDA